MVAVYRFMVICLTSLCGGCIVTCECAKKFWPKTRKGKETREGERGKKKKTNKQTIFTNVCFRKIIYRKMKT